jgi:amino acid transporter
MIPTNVKRPRNVDTPRAAAILYGDWGTSKAYVIGLAFAVAGYASFWLIALMCVLTALVGLNYMVICRLYPDGGGVYASVRHRSEVLSIVGAFLLIADYLVTAAISALSAFAYLGVPHPEKFAAAAILIIGLLNLLGPKQTGGLAFLISVPTAIVVITLALSVCRISAPLSDISSHCAEASGTIGRALSGSSSRCPASKQSPTPLA